MKTITLKYNGLGRYDDVSPFIITDNSLKLKIVLPEQSGEYYLITENNGNKEQRLLGATFCRIQGDAYNVVANLKGPSGAGLYKHTITISQLKDDSSDEYEYYFTLDIINATSHQYNLTSLRNYCVKNNGKTFIVTGAIEEANIPTNVVEGTWRIGGIINLIGLSFTLGIHPFSRNIQLTSNLTIVDSVTQIV